MDVAAFRSDVAPFALQWEGETGDPVLNNEYHDYMRVMLSFFFEIAKVFCVVFFS